MSGEYKKETCARDYKKEGNARQLTTARMKRKKEIREPMSPVRAWKENIARDLRLLRFSRFQELFFTNFEKEKKTEIEICKKESWKEKWQRLYPVRAYKSCAAR